MNSEQSVDELMADSSDDTGIQDFCTWTDEDETIEPTKIQMVLGALERCLVDYTIANLNHLDFTSGAAKRAYSEFESAWSRKPANHEEIICKSNLSQLPLLAKQSNQDDSLSKCFKRLVELCNSLQIFTTRNQSFGHPANHYHPVYWIRTQALALDPVMAQLRFYGGHLEKS